MTYFLAMYLGIGIGAFGGLMLGLEMGRAPADPAEPPLPAPPSPSARKELAA